MPRKGHPGPGAPPLQASVAEMRALAHPLRLRIMELFAEAPRTTKQVAELLDQPPTRLYHHVAALERAGLLRLKETRKNRGTVEKWYESVSRTLGAAPEKRRARPRKGTDTSVGAKRSLATATLEQSRQEVIAAIGSEDPPFVARLVFVGPPERSAQLRKRLYDFLKEAQREFGCAESEVEDDDQRWAMTMSFAPVWPKASDT